jgi:phenylacetate-CoA ligase
MIYDSTHETMDRDELQQLQIERLQMTLNRVYRNVAFYKQSFDEHKVNIEAVKLVEDLARLPFTTRDDLVRAYPYDMFALPLHDIVRIHSTSGTTGNPVVVGYSTNDLKHWTECTARVLAAAGITGHDVVQIAFDYSLFTGGFGFHQGAERIGASVIPASTGNVERQVVIARDYKTTSLLATPSYAMNIASEIRGLGIHPDSLFLRVGLFGAEPWSENLRAEIEKSLHLAAFDNYGLTEIMGPGVAYECDHRQGLHINEDHFIAEVVNPATGEPAGENTEGELVITTITKEGFPLVRYRTGDITSLSSEQCSCGRRFMRMGRIGGRTDDLIFFQSAKFFPSQIEQILLEAEEAAPHYRIVLEREGGVDLMEIEIEISESIGAIDELKNLERLRDTIRSRVETHIGVKPRVTLVEPKTLARVTEGKTRRVEDRRT